MASRLILHIGPQKSGTTYIQEVLTHSVDAVAAAGVVYPLPTGTRTTGARERYGNHEWATYGLLGTEYPWVSAQRAEAETRTWQVLERHVRREPGTVLLSAEALAAIRGPAIRRLLDRLGAGHVEVVITARALDRTLPSLWQQHIRNGRRLGFDRYLRMLDEQRNLPPSAVERDREPHFWRAFAAGRLVRRWAEHVGVARVRVVTSPGTPPELLWSRFAEATGLGALADPPADVGTRRVHTGLTAPEVLVLAALNTALDAAGWPPEQARRLRERVLADGFAPRTDRGPRLTLPPEWRARVRRWSAEDVADLRDTGATIVGDIDDLCPAAGPAADGEPTAEDLAAAGAAAALAAAHRPGSIMSRHALLPRRARTVS